MKTYFSVFTFLSLFLLISCGEKTVEPITPENNNRVTGKISNPSAHATNQISNEVGVESSTKLPNPEYDDAGVDYVALAKSICECAYESDKLNIEMQNLAASKKSKEFAAMAPKVNAAFQESIKCSKQKTAALKSEFSPFELVPKMKKECGDLDADLVAQILRGLGVPI